MRGFSSEMTQHLVAIAPQLTDAQRDEAVRKLGEMNSRLVGQAEKGIQMYQKGTEELDTFQRDVLPKLLHKAEEEGRAAEVQSAESHLQAS